MRAAKANANQATSVAIATLIYGTLESFMFEEAEDYKVQ